MSSPVIVVENLGKAFKRYPRVRDRLLEWLPGGRPRHELHWVLRDIDFTVGRGETLGLIGRNGAGKSTLLKILTGTLLASTGRVATRGRIAALLELGMGFHPDFSGWDNVLMAGQLQGLSRDEVLSCMDGIIAFAEIGDALTQPVRTYSSGMMVRLAFATATAIRPDVLIVDEALAVGDAYFQHKCFRRIREFREQGVTLLFVSHDPLAVRTLCNRAILIENGRIALDDAPLKVLDYYNALIALDEEKVQEHERHVQAGGQSRGTRSGTGEARIVSVRACQEGRETCHVVEGGPLSLSLDIEVARDVSELTAGILFRDRLGNEVFGTNTHYLAPEPGNSGAAAGERLSIRFDIPTFHLGPGSYSLTVALHGADSHLDANYDWWDQALVLEVGRGRGSVFTGITRLPLSATRLSLERAD